MIATFCGPAEWLSGRTIAEGAAIMLVSLLGTLALAVLVIVNLPADHFSAGPRPILSEKHWSLRLAVRIAKNLAGGLLVALGLVLSIPSIPGQGLLTILVGLTFLEFPGKRRLELAIVRRGRVLRVLNAVRARWRRAPLEIRA